MVQLKDGINEKKEIEIKCKCVKTTNEDKIYLIENDKTISMITNYMFPHDQKDGNF
jgi:hypothetical protein